jgi:hypothetical protein
LREHFYQFGNTIGFFGITRNVETGQLDGAGWVPLGNLDVKHSFIHDPQSFVSEIEVVDFQPEPIASFIAEKRHWVPSALVTTALALIDEGHKNKIWNPKRVYDAFSQLVSSVELRSEPTLS